MAHSGGDGYFVSFRVIESTVGGSRLPSNLVSLQVIRAKPVANPAVTRKGI